MPYTIPAIRGFELYGATSFGEGEIRTPETLSRLLAFQASAFDHSATSPQNAEHFGDPFRSKRRSATSCCAPPTAKPSGPPKTFSRTYNALYSRRVPDRFDFAVSGDGV